MVRFGDSVHGVDSVDRRTDPKRDPRTRVITVAYLALVAKTFKLPQDSSLILRPTDAIQRNAMFLPEGNHVSA